jgi:hypothetical protein
VPRSTRMRDQERIVWKYQRKNLVCRERTSLGNAVLVLAVIKTRISRTEEYNRLKNDRIIT